MTSKKFYFYIRNIDIDKVEEKYDLKYKSNLYEKITPTHNITFLDSLNPNVETPLYSYLDETKKNHECYMSMVKNNNLCNHCFWCRNLFNSIPIGCPIKFIPSYVLKKNFSNITKNHYILKENIKESDVYKYMNDDKYILNKRGYYITDGSFCSFNCCLSFINDNVHDVMYNQSKMLLTQIYYKIFNINMDVKPAPSWRLLKEYGGMLSIEEFRDSFKKITFMDHNIIENNQPIGFLFEKKINF